MSFLGIGAGAAGVGGGTVATAGVIATAAVAGAIGAAVVTAGGTQVAENLTQPDQTTANISSNVSQPHYAD